MTYKEKDFNLFGDEVDNNNSEMLFIANFSGSMSGQFTPGVPYIKVLVDQNSDNQISE